MNLWVHQLWCIFPPSIHIESSNITSKVSINDSIDIYHRINFKYIGLKEPINFFFFLTYQTPNNSFSHVRRPYLPWMLPGHDNYHFLFLLLPSFFSDCDLRYIIPTYRSADRFNSKLEGVIRIFVGNLLNLFKKFNKPCITIR